MIVLARINPRTALAMLHDVVAAGVAWGLAFASIGIYRLAVWIF